MASTTNNNIMTEDESFKYASDEEEYDPEAPVYTPTPKAVLAPVQLGVASFESTKDKEHMKDIGRYQLCPATMKGEACKFGSKCFRCHTLDDVQIDKCNHKPRCLLVVKTEDGYVNSKGASKPCPRMHHDETRDNVFERRGLLKFKDVVPVASQPQPRFVRTGSPMDKKEYLEKNGKTQLCPSVMNGEVCSFGLDKCMREHDVDKLVIQECPHGESCKKVVILDGKVGNSDRAKNPCPRSHAGEDNEAVIKRRGLDKFRGVALVIGAPKEAVKEAVKETAEYKVKPFKSYKTKPEARAPPKTTKTMDAPKIEPAEIDIKTMESLLALYKSGHIEITFKTPK
jgi:hypothetical protein